MRFTKRLSFRQKLIVAMIATTALALFMALAAFATLDRMTWQAAMVRELTSMADVIAVNSTAALSFGDPKTAKEILQSLGVRPTIDSACLYASSGKALAEYHRPGMETDAPPQEPGPDGFSFKNGYLVLFRPAVEGGERVGTVYIKADARELGARMRRYAAYGFVLVLACAAVAVLLAAGLQVLVSRPIMDLARAAKAVAGRRDYSVRVTQQSSDEIGDLTAAFNEMVAEVEAREKALRAAQSQLEQQVEQLKREVAERHRAQEALRQSEDQLRQAQKMEAIGKLAGGVAHDFNNILQAVLSNIQLLRTLPFDAEKLHGSIEALEHEVNRGAALARQLLVFSRRDTTNPEPLDLSEVVRRASGLLRSMVKENIAFELNLSALQLPVIADRGQLEQVLMNLVVNSSDAMPFGGRLIIKTEKTDEGLARLEVTDTGVGIPAQIVDRIFEPFFTTKDPSKGTGLGLSVVHGIVARYGGWVTVKSQINSGSSFFVVLPLAIEVEVSETRGEEGNHLEVSRGAGQRLLLVEDEPGARVSLAQIVEALGYQAVAVASAEEALRLPIRQPFDLLVSDILLPGLSGTDMARRLCERWPHLKVILMSGYAEDEAVRRGVSEGSVRFLQKPFGVEELAREIRAALQEDADGDPAASPAHSA